MSRLRLRATRSRAAERQGRAAEWQSGWKAGFQYSRAGSRAVGRAAGRQESRVSAQQGRQQGGRTAGTQGYRASGLLAGIRMVAGRKGRLSIIKARLGEALIMHRA